MRGFYLLVIHRALEIVKKAVELEPTNADVLFNWSGDF